MLWMAMEYSSAQGRPALSDRGCEALLRLVADGDQAAFAQFFSLTRRTVYAYTLSLTRHAQDAQDAMMDTYLAIRQGAGRYRPQGKPLAWVFTIARNAVNRQRRTRAKELPLAQLPETGAEDDLLPGLALRAALDRLEEDEREVVLLHAVSGLKHREIADILGRPLSTVLSRYHRALGKLRRSLEEVEDHETK